MRKYFYLLFFLPLVSFALPCSAKYRFDGKKLELTNKEWRERLSPRQYEILREGKTEAPLKNKYHDHNEKGIYRCAACDLSLFSSDDKFDSKTGWPSFTKPICPENVTIEKKSRYFFYIVNEVVCSRCESHLGDLFKDGPPPDRLRFCINSAALTFSANQ